MKELIKRSFSGVVFIAIITGLLLIHAYGLLLLVLLINIFAWKEFLALARTKYTVLQKSLLIISSSLSVAIAFFSSREISSCKILYIAVLVYILAAGILYFFLKRDTAAKRLVPFTGFFYISLPLMLISFLNKPGEEYQFQAILSIFIVLWINDSLAYATGSLWGKHRICAVSPKKTWEGFIGGLIFTLLAVFFLNRMFDNLFPEYSLIYSLLIVVSGTAGDFAESFLKRKAGKKDSGRFLPGHGGVLDRFDSFLFSIPFASVYLYILYYL